MRLSILLIMAVLQGTAISSGLYNLEIDDHLVNSHWRLFFTTSSSSTNPSFVLLCDKTEIRSIFCPVLNSFYLFEAGLSVPVSMRQSFGLSYTGQFSGSVNETVLYNGVPQNTGKKIKSNSGLLAVSYAVRPWEQFGMTIDGLKEKLLSVVVPVKKITFY